MSSECDRFLAAADRIGRRLCRDALWSGGRCNWLGWSMDFRGGQWITAYRAMGGILYDGTAGIALFLARLARLTGESITRTTAAGALAHALEAGDRLAASGDYGFYAGLAGIARTCVELGPLIDHCGLAERGSAELRRAAGMPPDRARLDLINGSAGLIPVLLEAAARDRRDEFLALAIAHGQHLLEQAIRSDAGCSWDTLGVPNQPPLLGYAHGTCGIACALAALARATGRQDFAETALEAGRYERSHFVPSQKNWPDLRNFVPARPDGEPVCMTAWCHGAPGIGIARLLLHRLFPDDPAILDEAETAVGTTAATLMHSPASGIGNCSLCHGDFGNADLLLVAADMLGRAELRQQAKAAALRALDRFEEAGMPWPCGVLGAGETPNLLLGLAGIGYFLLRLHDSKAVPSVLMPVPPPAVE